MYVVGGGAIPSTYVHLHPVLPLFYPRRIERDSGGGGGGGSALLVLVSVWRRRRWVSNDDENLSRHLV